MRFLFPWLSQREPKVQKFLNKLHRLYAVTDFPAQPAKTAGAGIQHNNHNTIPTMKINEIIAMSAADRITGLRETVTKHSSTIKVASKYLVAFTIAGDCATNELNAFAKKHPGMDIRKEIQGIYQTVKVLQLIATNMLGDVTEDQFDSIPWSANIELSRFLNPESELWFLRDKAINAYAGPEPVKNLKALIKSIKEKPEQVTITDNAAAASTTQVPVESTTTETETETETTPTELNLEIITAWLRKTGAEMTVADRDQMLEKLYYNVFVHFESLDHNAALAAAKTPAVAAA